MMEFVRGNLATIAGSLILLSVFVLIIRGMIKHGSCDCGGGCDHCSGCCACRGRKLHAKETPARAVPKI